MMIPEEQWQLGQLVFTNPRWEDLERLYCPPSQDNPLDYKAALFNLAGSIRGVIVEEANGKKYVHTMHGIGGKSLAFATAYDAIKCSVNSEKEMLESRLAHMQSIEKLVDVMREEGQL